MRAAPRPPTRADAIPVIPSAATASQLRPGDNLTVAIIGVPDPSNNSVQVDDQGIISLPYIGTIKASGETTGGLTQRIREAYVDKKIYTSVDISVTVTERYVYVGGEVQKPGRIIWTQDLTAAKAVQAAQADSRSTRRRTRSASCATRCSTSWTSSWPRRTPSQDPRLEPGDSIEVPRSAF